MLIQYDGMLQHPDLIVNYNVSQGIGEDTKKSWGGRRGKGRQEVKGKSGNGRGERGSSRGKRKGVSEPSHRWITFGCGPPLWRTGCPAGKNVFMQATSPSGNTMIL